MSTPPPSRNIPKVFCSHRSVDKPRVCEIARKLREAGIDAWLDEWEIKPGEDIVTAMNDALASCDVGLIFFSNEVEHGKWVQAEISTITLRAIEDGKSVIPVMLDPNTPIPPLLRPRCRLGYEQVDQLIDAIYGRTTKPALGLPRSTVRQRHFIIHLRRAGQAEIAVRAELDGATVAEQRPVHLGADFRFSYDDFLQARFPNARHSAETLSAERDRELRQLGDAVGRVLFHDGIERSFTDLLNHATAANEAVELIVETEVPQLLTIPFEAARLSDGRTPALESGVRMVRRLAAVRSGSQSPQPGPLKILVAVGAPDDGKTSNAVLDIERELQTILDAVENARQYGNAYVRILDVGSPDQIRGSLKEQAYHVLHLSGHGNAGVLELEDEDGNSIPVSAADLAGAIRDSGHPAPFIFLASCLSGAGDSDTASLAQGLLQQGVPAVMAMQTSVTDKYATNLAAAFYTNLSTSDRPVASQALALARQQLERDRRKGLERGEHIPAEYATPSFFCTGEETPILDRSLEFVRPLEHTRKLTSGVVPMLSIGDLIGRRVELRRVMRVLTEDERSIAEIGRKAGCQLLGIGGVGKSAIAGRAMARLSDEGWTCVAITGQWTFSELATTISAGLLTTGDPAFNNVGRNLAKPLPDEVRFKVIANLLANHQLLLVLDNFEDNLKLEPKGIVFRDPATAQLIQLLCRSAQRGKLLITSRYPVPEAGEWLATEEPGPLSPAQTRKLMLRLSALRAQEPDGLRLIHRSIGGHPRMLEYLDAILRRGKARVPDVVRRLNEQAKRQGLNLADASATLGDAVRAALQVGAGDILLDELLELVAEHEGDLDAFYQVSVFPRPVSIDGLAFCIAGGRAAVQAQVADVRRAVERIAQASLLTRTADESVWVHRWTAEVLRSRIAP
jgi:CHAT domain/TIR domain